MDKTELECIPEDLKTIALGLIVDRLKDGYSECGADLSIAAYADINCTGSYSLATAAAEENMKKWSYYFISEVIPYMWDLGYFNVSDIRIKSELREKLEDVCWQECMCIFCATEQIVNNIEFFRKVYTREDEDVDYWQDDLDDFAREKILEELKELNTTTKQKD